ncbi:MAG: dockerin type I repeat-containing protein [Candidatus Omnitrophica bacterium]|nr:dockerin type I repeat-containing protein [Candidatus Omnitrophota bacterium]
MWRFWSYGELYQPLNFTKGGLYQVAITEQQLLNGSNAYAPTTMNVYVGPKLFSFPVTNKTIGNITFTVDIPDDFGVQDLLVSAPNGSGLLITDISITYTGTRLGDVTGNGAVTMYDAALTLRGGLPTAEQARADVNSDSTVDAADAKAIARKALGLK